MKIRLLRPEEVNEASKIIGQNYTKEFQRSGKKELRSMFSNAAIRPKYFVLIDKGKIIGLGGFTQSWMDYSIYEIFWINVLQNRQNQGLGKRIVGRILKEIRKDKNARQILLTADAEKNLQKYYAIDFGFETIRFYEHSHLMALALS